ncbi:3-oxoacyl-ACP synthase [Pasteurella canis]|uniref:3-oxoacyl-ACP synthase n=1 Tax=Pasteurella canis TaxID=753 RepID=A0A379ERQ8_9PAST|nr:3-oxoacyl-ACP synthase [Pasteurella canis]
MNGFPKRTGIKERRIAEEHETVASMGFEAAKKCLDMSPMDVNEIDLIIVATTSSTHAFPSAACQIQKMLEIKDAIAFDVAAACSGFVYALTVADQFIRTGKVNKALVIGADLFLSYFKSRRSRYDYFIWVTERVLLF